MKIASYTLKETVPEKHGMKQSTMDENSLHVTGRGVVPVSDDYSDEIMALLQWLICNEGIVRSGSEEWLGDLLMA